jgi:hypothetical protein
MKIAPALLVFAGMWVGAKQQIYNFQIASHRDLDSGNPGLN